MKKVVRNKKDSWLGMILVVVLVFTTVLLVIMGGLVTLITSQNKSTVREVSWHRSLAIAESGINYYRWHLAHDINDYQDGTGTRGPDITVEEMLPSSYETASLIVGDEYYIDRNYTISSIPEDYEDLLWIKTSNEDGHAYSTDEEFLMFEVNREVYVYVAYDDRATSLPNWLADDFTDIGESIGVTDIGVNTLNLYKKKFFTGSVTLGGNFAEGAAGAESMYAVLIQPTETNGPYIHDYTDPYGDIIGQYSIEITPPVTGSTVVVLKSVGWTVTEPTVKRILLVRYGIPSLARYAYLTNNNIWFGETEEIRGEVHSNGGIRMDGTGNARMTSARETYICGPEHGCSNEEKPGVWGTGEDPALWEYPVDSVDFDEITIDLSNIRDEAQAEGVYLGSSGSLGYHVTFLNDGTFDLYRVTGLWPSVWGHDGNQWIRESNSWRNHVFLDNYSIPENGLIFAEDDVWVDGEVNGRALLASARFPEVPATNTSIRIQNDITYYNNHNGTSALGLIAQKDILIPLRSEDELIIEAALLAQKGHVFRYYYPDWYAPWHLRDRIEVYGGVITNTIWTFSWVSCDGCPVISGYSNTQVSYDPFLLYAPPPSFPTSGEYSFISWEELFKGEDF
ncbi:hypothetical protein KKG41_03335 [Patescibacteria group bacterium]|nr:hypothetical protein [Patescibacteria group bacterium]MBU1890106.1 hypothetical protein [Patescibacteria group bacterium]